MSFPMPPEFDPVIPELIAPPYDVTQHPPWAADSAIAPAQAHQPAGSIGKSGRRRTTLLVLGAGLIIGAAAAFALGAASLATRLYLNSVTLPRVKVEQQVADVLQHSYQVGHVTNVSCPERISGHKGSSFVCSYTAAGSDPGKVIVTMLNDQGSLQVQPPPT
jgi:hypothetical protein